MNNMLLWVMLVIDAVCIVVSAATPYLTRKTELFGVSLPSAEIGRPELSAMRRAYVRLSLLAGAILVALTFVLFARFQSEVAQVRILLILLFAYIAAEFLIYLVFHYRMKAFKAAQPWAAHGASARGEHKAGGRSSQAAANGAAGERGAGSGGGQNVGAGTGGGQYADASSGGGPNADAGAVSGQNAGASASSGQYAEAGAFAEPVLIVDTAPPSREVVHPLWLLLFALVGVATLIYLWQVWPALPDTIPIHWNAAGAVDRWADKDSGGVATLLIGQWILIAVFVLVYFLIPASKRQIDAADPLRSREQGRRFRHLMSACMVFGGAAFALVLGFLPVVMAQSGGGTAYIAVALIIIFAILAAIIIVILRVGQGGSRLNVKADASDAPYSPDAPGDSRTQKRLENTDDDCYWVLGQFYFNRKDPAVFVEKRFGVGWTFNLARPATWALAAAIAAVVIGSLIFAFNAG